MIIATCVKCTPPGMPQFYGSIALLAAERFVACVKCGAVIKSNDRRA